MPLATQCAALLQVCEMGFACPSGSQRCRSAMSQLYTPGVHTSHWPCALSQSAGLAQVSDLMNPVRPALHTSRSAPAQSCSPLAQAATLHCLPTSSHSAAVSQVSMVFQPVRSLLHFC